MLEELNFRAHIDSPTTRWWWTDGVANIIRVPTEKKALTEGQSESRRELPVRPDKSVLYARGFLFESLQYRNKDS